MNPRFPAACRRERIGECHEGITEGAGNRTIIPASLCRRHIRTKCRVLHQKVLVKRAKLLFRMANMDFNHPEVGGG